MSSLQTIIEDDIKRLVQHKSFKAWKREQQLKPHGLVVVNNSFVFRDVSTNKAEEYVALRVADTGDLTFPPVIASGFRINLDLKYLPPFSSLPTTRSLNAAVADGMKHLGELVFILIGEVEDSRVLSEQVNHADFNEIAWNPFAERFRSCRRASYRSGASP